MFVVDWTTEKKSVLFSVSGEKNSCSVFDIYVGVSRGNYEVV